VINSLPIIVPGKMIFTGFAVNIFISVGKLISIEGVLMDAV